MIDPLTQRPQAPATTTPTWQRRALLLMLVLVVAVFTAACGGDDDADDEPKATTTAAQEETETEETESETETTATEEEPAEEEGSADGKALFASNCSICHGATATGGNGGPPITAADDVADITEQILKGGGGMPAFEGQLSEGEATAIAEYVASL